MDDMQFAKYICEIREVLENVSEENLENKRVMVQLQNIIGQDLILAE